MTPDSGHLTVCLAYARPKMMRRVLRSLGQFQVSNLVFFQSFLCDKSYSQSSLYQEDSLLPFIEEGFSQIRSANSISAQFFTGFKPFLEDFLLKEFSSEDVLFAEPEGGPAPLSRSSLPKALVFGPERGFSQKELELIASYTLPMESFGSHHLRLETAVPYIFGHLHTSLARGLQEEKHLDF